MTKKDKLSDEYTDDILSSFLDKSTNGQDEVDYRMKLAAKIYHAMKAKGWNQKQFADIMGKQDSIVSRWMSGTHNFETDTLFKIGKILNINLIDLTATVKPFDKNIEVSVTLKQNDPPNLNVFVLLSEYSSIKKDGHFEVVGTAAGIQVIKGVHACTNQ